MIQNEVPPKCGLSLAGAMLICTMVPLWYVRCRASGIQLREKGMVSPIQVRHPSPVTRHPSPVPVAVLIGSFLPGFMASVSHAADVDRSDSLEARFRQLRSRVISRDDADGKIALLRDYERLISDFPDSEETAAVILFYARVWTAYPIAKSHDECLKIATGLNRSLYHTTLHRRDLPISREMVRRTGRSVGVPSIERWNNGKRERMMEQTHARTA